VALIHSLKLKSPERQWDINDRTELASLEIVTTIECRVGEKEEGKGSFVNRCEKKVPERGGTALGDLKGDKV